MAGDVKLRIGGDTTELVAAVKAAMAQIQKEGDKLKITPTAAKGAGGSQAYQSFQKAYQETRAQENKNRLDQQALQITKNGLKDIERQLATNARLEVASAKNEKEKTFYASERNKLEKEYQTLLGTRENIQRRMGQRPAGPGQPGGIAGAIPKGGITSIGDVAKFLGPEALMALAAGVTAVAGVKLFESARVLFSQTGIRANVTEASAFNRQGQGGQRLEALLTGGAAGETIFNPQRIQAAEIARQTMEANLAERNRAGRLLTHPIEIMRELVKNGTLGAFDPLGTEVEARRRDEQSAIQEQQFEALRNGPAGKLRTVLANQYLQNYQRDLNFQRETGLNMQTFRGPGGFLPGIQGAGFTGEQGMGMASGILGGGGSTRAATGLAGVGLQAQRNLDITNASSLIAKLSGGLGSAETTKEGFVKLLAEGTRVGLDGSDFREESRKFVESAADMISKSGVTTGAGIDQLLSQFGRFFGDRTMTGIEAGKGAFELYRQTSMAQTGPRGMMRAAGMLTDPTISRLSRNSREALFNMPIDQLTPDNPAVIAMAQEAGTTPEALIESQNRITSRSANLFRASDIARDRLAAVKRKYGLRSAIGYQGPYSPQAYSEVGGALGQSNIAQIREHPELGQNQRMASEYSDALAAGDSQRQSKALEDAKSQQLGANVPTGRPEDETVRIQAQASRLANELFMSIKDSIVPASDAAKSFARDIDTLTAALKRGTPAQISTAIQNFQSNYPGMMPSTQPSAGSPSSGGGSGGQ